MTLVDRAVWQIETKLHQPLSLTELAGLCAVSPYHLSRMFRSITGLSPMTYLRARRLSAAAESLAAGDEDLLTIALEAQYGSHEAFTRAFVGYFGLLPSSVRAARSIQPLVLMEPLKMKKSLLVDVAAPEIREREAFRVVGLGTHCTFEDTSAIPSLWQAFNERENDVPAAVGGSAYGVCCDADEAGRFRYVAGVESTASSNIPPGMDAVSIPASRYAVFVHSGHITELPKTVYTIWNKALPDAGIDPARLRISSSTIGASIRRAVAASSKYGSRLHSLSLRAAVRPPHGTLIVQPGSGDRPQRADPRGEQAPALACLMLRPDKRHG